MADTFDKTKFKSRCRAYDETCIKALGALATNAATDPGIKIEAMKLLFAYGHKKPGASRTKKEHSGTINVVLRHITDGKPPGEK
jgi:hypothetical protein